MQDNVMPMYEIAVCLFQILWILNSCCNKWLTDNTEPNDKDGETFID